jgi:hypothetical protein
MMLCKVQQQCVTSFWTVRAAGHGMLGVRCGKASHTRQPMAMARSPVANMQTKAGAMQQDPEKNKSLYLYGAAAACAAAVAFAVVLLPSICCLEHVSFA